ncbi:hypothetical protein JX266_000015 [Neoarthrinium moseri]|nr:hypothetical protein JX266_000015 [Neoarthrinium moseri]
MDIQQTRTRLRRTFAYPADESAFDDAADDDDDGAPALDETEQDELISALSTANHGTNAQFRLLLLALPAVSAVPYALALADPRAQGLSRTAAVLALTSLASTAGLLWGRPAGTTGIGPLDRWAAGAPGAEDTLHGDHGARAASTRRRSRRDSFSLPQAVPLADGHGPLGTWLPYLNLGLCALLVLMGLLGAGTAAGRGAAAGAVPRSWGHVGLPYLPAVIYAVVLLANVVMGGVDPERELSGLKYEYKGA